MKGDRSARILQMYDNLLLGKLSEAQMRLERRDAIVSIRGSPRV